VIVTEDGNNNYNRNTQQSNHWVQTGYRKHLHLTSKNMCKLIEYQVMSKNRLHTV